MNTPLQTFDPSKYQRTGEHFCSSCNDVNICDSTLGIDKMLKHYEINRDVLLNELKSPNIIRDIWENTIALSKDTECCCKLGTQEFYTRFICSSCRSIGRLTDLKKHVVDTPFLIACGKSAGKAMVIKEYLLKDVGLTDESSKLIKVRMLKVKKCNKSEDSSIKPTKLLTGDSFTTRTLVNMIIEKQMKTSNLPHYMMLHMAFICGTSGYMLYDNPTIGTIDKLGTLDEDKCSNIIKQLYVIFSELDKNNFYHGSPSAVYSLLFNKDPIGYRYNDIIVSSEFTLMLSNLQNSSISYKDTQICPDNSMYDLFFSENPLDVQIDTDGSLYKLNPKNIDVYIAYRMHGLSLYSGSFNFYGFMMALMLYPQFRAVVDSSEKLRNIWLSLWKSTDITEVNRRISNGFGEVNLANLWLDCDILSKVVKMM